ncbi:hypothetical protein QOT17_011888 [Balamuthia mandrillaris]
MSQGQGQGRKKFLTSGAQLFQPWTTRNGMTVKLRFMKELDIDDIMIIQSERYRVEYRESKQELREMLAFSPNSCFTVVQILPPATRGSRPQRTRARLAHQQERVLGYTVLFPWRRDLGFPCSEDGLVASLEQNAEDEDQAEDNALRTSIREANNNRRRAMATAEDPLRFSDCDVMFLYDMCLSRICRRTGIGRRLHALHVYVTRAFGFREILAIAVQGSFEMRHRHLGWQLLSDVAPKGYGTEARPMIYRLSDEEFRPAVNQPYYERQRAAL